MNDPEWKGKLRLKSNADRYTTGDNEMYEMFKLIYSEGTSYSFPRMTTRHKDAQGAQC